MKGDNPFERFDIDPLDGPAAITERMRELVERASPAEQKEIRAAWEELTLHPLRRLRAALSAHPETRPPLCPPAREPGARSEPLRIEELRVDDLRLGRGVEAALGPGPDRLPEASPPLEQDRILHGR